MNLFLSLDEFLLENWIKKEYPFQSTINLANDNIQIWIKLYNHFYSRNKINTTSEYHQIIIKEYNQFTNKIKRMSDEKWIDYTKEIKTCLNNCFNQNLDKFINNNIYSFLNDIKKRINPFYSQKESLEFKENFISFIYWILDNNKSLFIEHSTLNNININIKLFKNNDRIQLSEIKSLIPQNENINFYDTEYLIINNDINLSINFNDKLINNLQLIDKILETNKIYFLYNGKQFDSIYSFIKWNKTLLKNTPEILFQEKLNLDILFKEFILFNIINKNKKLKHTFEIKINQNMDEFYINNNLYYNSLLNCLMLKL